MAFNYGTIYSTEEERVSLHERLIEEHYLKQFNEETIVPRRQHTCGEPCTAVCKKMRGEYKKDYEPYQAFGPLCGVFDQRAAEQIVRHADTAGFDAISAGGVVAWMMEALVDGLLSPEDLGVSAVPRWNTAGSDPVAGFDPVADSAHNARIGGELLDSILLKRGVVDLSEGARSWGRRLGRARGIRLLDHFVYTAFGRRGWMVPNQYWTPGVLAPMPIMGKYYMYYGAEFAPPRTLGRMCAERFLKELSLDNTGFCRFHRGWVEELVPDIIGSIFGRKEEFLASTSVTGTRINSRNSSVYWESERNLDFVLAFLRRERSVSGSDSPELASWIERFEKDKSEAGLDWWFEMRKGIDESLREFDRG